MSNYMTMVFDGGSATNFTEVAVPGFKETLDALESELNSLTGNSNKTLPQLFKGLAIR